MHPVARWATVRGGPPPCPHGLMRPPAQVAVAGRGPLRRTAPAEARRRAAVQVLQRPPWHSSLRLPARAAAAKGWASVQEGPPTLHGQMRPPTRESATAQLGGARPPRRPQWETPKRGSAASKSKRAGQPRLGSLVRATRGAEACEAMRRKGRGLSAQKAAGRRQARSGRRRTRRAAAAQRMWAVRRSRMRARQGQGLPKRWRLQEAGRP